MSVVGHAWFRHSGSCLGLAACSAVSEVSPPTTSPLGGRYTWAWTQFLITSPLILAVVGLSVSLPAYSVWFHTHLRSLFSAPGLPRSGMLDGAQQVHPWGVFHHPSCGN